MPQSIFRPTGKEANKASAFMAKSLLPTLLAFLRPSQYHSTVLEDPAPTAHAQASLWAATPNQQLPMLGRLRLLTGSSTEGHCPRTGAGLWEGLYRMSVTGSYLHLISVHLCSPSTPPASSSCLSAMFGVGRNCG